MMLPRNRNRAARIAALYELDRLGYLDGLTYQQIADALGLDHRSTAYRTMQDVAALADLVEQYKAALRAVHPPLVQ